VQVDSAVVFRGRFVILHDASPMGCVHINELGAASLRIARTTIGEALFLLKGLEGIQARGPYAVKRTIFMPDGWFPRRSHVTLADN
jgi:hypothetical protein